MARDSFTKKKNDFLSYIRTKNLTQVVYRKFSSELLGFIKENRDDFCLFFDFILEVRDKDLTDAISSLNKLISEENGGNLTAIFISDWSYTYLGPGEIICLIINSEAKSGRKRLPDIIFEDNPKRIEIKSYNNGFRLTESTSFFTDLGTIIQALVQGGFLTSLTEINNNDLRKGLRHFGEAFLCKRGFIELQNKIWKIESKTDDKIVFVKSPDTDRDIIKYSMVRNSLRNWIGRGTLSIQLMNIIDPSRKTKITKKEIQNYVKNVIGHEDRIPIPLEQYFHLCSLDSMIIYDKSLNSPFSIIREEDLGKFKLERLSQAKVTYTKK
jgi:hypothetical protein